MYGQALFFDAMCHPSLSTDTQEERTFPTSAYRTQCVGGYWTPPTTFPSPQAVAIGPVPFDVRAMPGYTVNVHNGVGILPPMSQLSATVSPQRSGACGPIGSMAADTTDSASSTSGFLPALPSVSAPSSLPEASTDTLEPLEQCSTQLPTSAKENPVKPHPAHVPKPRKDTLISGPDVPLVDIDLDALIQSHNDMFKFPTQVKEIDKAGVDVKPLLDSGRQSLLMLGSWFRSVPTFMQLRQENRVKCLRACWVDQAILSLVFRSVVQTPDEGLLFHSGIKMATTGSIKHSLTSYIANRIMGELMAVFKGLELDYKEFVIIRLLVLLNPGVCVCICCCTSIRMLYIDCIGVKFNTSYMQLTCYSFISTCFPGSRCSSQKLHAPGFFYVACHLN